MSRTRTAATALALPGWPGSVRHGPLRQAHAARCTPRTQGFRLRVRLARSICCRGSLMLARIHCSLHRLLERGRPPMTPNSFGARVFAIANQKGGVGKTTTTINLAACLADAGRRTLVVDLDPQSNTTTGLGVDAHRVGGSIYEL